MITTWDELYENQHHQYRYYVHCSKCSERRHWMEAVQLVDFGSDDEGRDIVEFVCPETKYNSVAWVYKT